MYLSAYDTSDTDTRPGPSGIEETTIVEEPEYHRATVEIDEGESVESQVCSSVTGNKEIFSTP